VIFWNVTLLKKHELRVSEKGGVRSDDIGWHFRILHTDKQFGLRWY